jgi:hypothetical protein
MEITKKKKKKNHTQNNHSPSNEYLYFMFNWTGFFFFCLFDMVTLNSISSENLVILLFLILKRFCNCDKMCIP